MIWSAGNGLIRLADSLGMAGTGTGTHASARAIAGGVTGAGAHGVRGTLEQALPGEWVALVLTLVAIAVVGAAILVATCLGHGRTVARRRARQLARRGSTRTAA